MSGILFRGQESDPQTLDEVVGQAVAEGATCWEDVSAAGKFNHARARAVVDEAVAWIQAHHATVAPVGPSPEAVLQGVREAVGRIFAGPADLDDYLHYLNGRGEPARVALLDSVGQLWLTYGEDVSSGGESMTCWLMGDVDDDGPWPWAVLDAHKEAAECFECGQRPARPIPLSAAAYPVVELARAAP